LQSTLLQRRFVDREDEIRVLDKAFSERPGMLVIYGRRRIGKTRLLAEWLHRRKPRHVYFVAQLTNHEQNLARMSEAAAEQLGEPVLSYAKFAGLTHLLKMIATLGAEVVVIDEFTYWAKASARVLSELQEFVDHHLPQTTLLLVISGSLMGVMLRRVLSGGSPLYARARRRIKLGELRIRDARQFVPWYSGEDIVRLYSMIGGLPYYYEIIRSASNLSETLELLFAKPGGILVEEKDLVLREELREPYSYNAILSALAKGYSTPGRIASVTGLEAGRVNKYLHVMEYLGFVERHVPLFRKKGYYRIRDPILRAWYTLYEPVQYLVELGKKDEAMRRIGELLETKLVPSVWEELLMRYLLYHYASKGFTLAGKLEHKSIEVDAAVANPVEKKIIVGEAKWSTLTRNDADRLRRKTLEKTLEALPKGYSVAGVYIAAKKVSGAAEEWIVTPEKIVETL